MANSIVPALGESAHLGNVTVAITMKAVLSCLFLVALLHLCGGYKILVVFPLAGKSHNILGTGYVKHLLEAGHEVTYATPFPSNKTTAKYHEVDLSKNIQNMEKNNISDGELYNNCISHSETTFGIST